MKCAPAGMELSVQERARWPALPVKAHENMRIAEHNNRVVAKATKLTPLGAQPLVDILYEAACHHTCRWSRVAQAT